MERKRSLVTVSSSLRLSTLLLVGSAGLFGAQGAAAASPPRTLKLPAPIVADDDKGDADDDDDKDDGKGTRPDGKLKKKKPPRRTFREDLVRDHDAEEKPDDTTNDGKAPDSPVRAPSNPAPPRVPDLDEVNGRLKVPPRTPTQPKGPPRQITRPPLADGNDGDDGQSVTRPPRTRVPRKPTRPPHTRPTPQPDDRYDSGGGGSSGGGGGGGGCCCSPKLTGLALGGAVLGGVAGLVVGGAAGAGIGYTFGPSSAPPDPPSAGDMQVNAIVGGIAGGAGGVVLGAVLGMGAGLVIGGTLSE